MIDEKKLIDILEGESYLTTNDDGETDKFSVQVVEWKDIKKIVKDLASEHNNGWISVEDRLPKESMPVLVTTGTEMIWTAFYDRTHGTWVDDVRGKVLNVIAWMELPAPYKKGE